MTRCSNEVQQPQPPPARNTGRRTLPPAPGPERPAPDGTGSRPAGGLIGGADSTAGSRPAARRPDGTGPGGRPAAPDADRFPSRTAIGDWVDGPSVRITAGLLTLKLHDRGQEATSGVRMAADAARISCTAS
ncbi:hypothetical protein [Streptomyces sp. NPDC003247]|uniref:hypothetical protein n=1 Tax=Streptomyces sp. NPDC003247 TaxID=3364677 RepID=UPI0036AA0948